MRTPDLGETHALVNTQRKTLHYLRHGINDARKHAHGHDGTFASDIAGVNTNNPVESNFRWSLLLVPVAGAHVDIATTVFGFADFTNAAGHVVFAGEHESQEPFVVAPNNEHGAVLALLVVLFVWHPAPHDFPWVGVAVEVGGVEGFDGARVVAGVSTVGLFWKTLLGAVTLCLATGGVVATLSARGALRLALGSRRLFLFGWIGLLAQQIAEDMGAELEISDMATAKSTAGSSRRSPPTTLT